MTQTERVLPLFPLEQVVLFPGMSLPLHIFEERYKVMIGACQVTDQLFGVLLIKNGSEVGAPAQPERVGCTARMLRIDRLPDGRMTILTIGEQRFRLQGPARVMSEGYLVGDIRPQEFRHRIETPALRGVNIQRLFGSQRALKTVEDFTEFEQRAAYFDGDPVIATKKGVNVLERGSQVHRQRRHARACGDRRAAIEIGRQRF